MNKAAATSEPELVVSPSVVAERGGAVDTTPGGMLRVMVGQGRPAAELKDMMELQERWEANQARKAYVAAMAEFKRNPPEILKDKAVGYDNKDGTFTGYKHASLGNVTSAICAGLAQHGFSHNWDVKQDAQITVKCTITHALGHSESVQMTAGKDDSGKKNAIQQIASAVAYLQRYTLLAATGLATQDVLDDDGKTGGTQAFVRLTDKHQLEVQAKCEEISKTTLSAVLKSYKAKSLAEIPESEYDSIMHRLEITAKGK